MSIESRKLKVGDFALTDYNENGKLTRVKIIELDDTRKNGHSQSGVMFRVLPILKNGHAYSWYDADWFEIEA